MTPKYDPDIEELNTGTIRQRFPRHYTKKPKQQQIARTGKWCQDCDKQGYATEEAARQVIGNVARHGKLTEAGSFAIHPYLCHHGWWHVGRNKRTLRKFKEFFEKRLGNLTRHPLGGGDQPRCNERNRTRTGE